MQGESGAQAVPTSLGHRASRGVLVTLSGLWAKTLIQLIATVSLARMLDPNDFGLIAMVTAVLGVVDVIRDFGLTAAIVQARKIDERQWSGVLWLSVAIGAVLTVIVALLAPVIAWFYGEERLLILTLAVAPMLLFNGLAMPLQASIQRNLQFGTLARIDVVSMVVGVVCGISAAALGAGVWALVLMAATSQGYRLITFWIIARPRFGRPHIGRDVIPLVTMGGNVLGTQLLSYAVRNLDNVLIGKQLGAGPLGLYSRAYALFLLPLQQINGPLGRVALPVLSRLQDEGERFRRYIRNALLVIGYVTFPVYAITAVAADPLIAILLGPGWELSASIFAILTIAGVAQVMASVQGWINMSLGHAARHFAYMAFHSCVIIIAFIVGIHWNGVEGLALLYGLASMGLLLPGFWWAIRGTFIRGTDIVLPLVRPALLAPLCFFASSWAARSTEDAAPLLDLMVTGSAGLAILVVAHVVPAIRQDTRTLVGLLLKARKPPHDSVTGS